MNITDPRFRYIPAAGHNTTEGLQAFRDRQRERMRRAQGVDTVKVTMMGDAKIEELRKEAWRRGNPFGGKP